MRYAILQKNTLYLVWRPTLLKKDKAYNSYETLPSSLLPSFDLIQKGKLLEASKHLSAFIEEKDSKNDEVLRAYSLLIRIAAETRNFKAISTYVDKISNFVISTKEDDLSLGRCFYATGTAWVYAGDYKKAKIYFESSHESATRNGDIDLEFINEIALLNLLRVEQKYTEVIEKIAALKEKYQSSDNLKQKISLLIVEGNIYRKKGHFSKAIALLDEARVHIRNKNSSDYHYVLWALGTCFAALEDKEKAKIYLSLATNHEDGVEFWRINVLSMLSIAKLHTAVGEYELAEEVYDRLQKEVGGDETDYYSRRMIGGRALLSIKKSDFDKANALIDRLVIIAAKENNVKELMRLRLLKAEVLLRNGGANDHDEAQTMLQEALGYYQEKQVPRHLAVCLEILSRLDSRANCPNDALKKINEVNRLAREGFNERQVIRSEMALMVLERKLGKTITAERIEVIFRAIRKMNLPAYRVILRRFMIDSYDEWTAELNRLDSHHQRYVNEFFEDFHFVPNQSTDIEIDSNSHYVREKHLGEIPFHNKFTLMKILCLLAREPGREYNKEELANIIWEQDYNPLRHDNNIYININRLRKLIEPNPRESRYIMNGSRGYYFNPTMKVNIATKIADTAPRTQGLNRSFSDINT